MEEVLTYCFNMPFENNKNAQFGFNKYLIIDIKVIRLGIFSALLNK